jgi:type I restriction enzyme R subunit
MPKQKKAPELKFQQHIADYFVRFHKYGVLEQSDISDTENSIAEAHLWAFIRATQSDTIKKLTEEYGTDARKEIFNALRKELEYTPLWMIFRNGLQVRSQKFLLYYPKPRSSESVAGKLYNENRISFRPHFYFGKTNQEIDFIIYLNGLPIVAVELKHEANQNVHDAVAQFTKRDQNEKIFRLPFLYIAADTSDVMAATDPGREENFRWHNRGLTNEPLTKDGSEYPVEFLYAEVLSKDHLLEALSFFLVRTSRKDADDDKPEIPAYTIYPRYHQSRLVRRLAADITERFAVTNDIGKKYLVNHSAGSGKTLTICWLADRLQSLYKPGTNEKLVDIVFILTDRKSLDKNIRDEIEKFTHLKDVVGIAKDSEDLPLYLADRKPIIATLQQKFSWVLSEIQNNPELKKLRVAFLIDEAHRSQEGRMGAAIRLPFRNADEPDDETPEKETEEEIAEIIRAHDANQLFVAFTATPSPATVTLFGKSFDTYTEAEAIAEDYIVDVATSIISYKTLYNLHCPIVPNPAEEKVYPKGVVLKALKNVAFQDEELIQYKAEVMLRIFEKDVKPLIKGRAKAMIVTSSRIAGLRYFTIIKEKLKERGADYKVLYAFTDFDRLEDNKHINEHAINELEPGELIEDRFEGESYRIMIVANKFQAGFDEPLLAGMFLDKPVVDRNAVQTVSRLNRCCEGKEKVIVVDFTNNAKAILKAFIKYRKGTPFEPEEPDKELCLKQYAEIIAAGIFTQTDASDFAELIKQGTDAQVQFRIHALRERFYQKIPNWDARKALVLLLARFTKTYYFLNSFFSYGQDIVVFALFTEYVGPQLVKQGKISDLMEQIHKTGVIKTSVQFQGVTTSTGKVTLKPGKGRHGFAPPVQKVSVQDMIEKIKKDYVITDEEALYIREVSEEKISDPEIRTTVQTHQADTMFLEGAYRGQVNGKIQTAYEQRGRYDELADTQYTGTGGIFDIMAMLVIDTHLYLTGENYG